MNVYTARWLLPVTAPPVRDGAVGVGSDGRIAYVGPAADAPAGERYALGDAVLLPGLVAVDQVRDPAGDDGHHLLPPLSAGVTSLATTIGGREFDFVVHARFRGVAYWRVGGPMGIDRVVSFGMLRHVIPELRAHLAAEGGVGRARIGVAVGAAYEVDEDALIDLCAWAVGEDLPISMTVGASRDEVAYLREASGRHADARRAAGFDVVRRAHSAVHLLAELGIAAVARPLLIGGAYFDASDAALAAYYDCPVAYAPTDADTSDLAAFHALRDAGARVALATHDPLGLAARLVRDADAAVRLATLDSARALDVGDEVGSLEVGKLADLTAFALAPDDARAADLLGPAQALLGRARTHRPLRSVLRMVGGHPVRPRGV